MLPVEGMVGAVDPSVAGQNGMAGESGSLRFGLRGICVWMGAADIDTQPASTL